MTTSVPEICWVTVERSEPVTWAEVPRGYTHRAVATTMAPALGGSVILEHGRMGPLLRGTG